jgi:NAD(P)-dependent dehydrogenase (short-subunit alcohol dehydrogenase family)
MAATSDRRAEAQARSPRRLIISGGTSGIGYACAERLAGRGDAVWVLGSTDETVRAAQARLPLAGAAACDVADEAQVEKAVSAAAAQLGGFDGIFVNAGMDGQGVPATELSVAGLRRVLDVNVVGAFLVARAALRSLHRPGAMVLNASVNAIRPEVNFMDYNASKAAVVAMAKSLALELSGHGVTVTAICPGYFPTRMTAPYLEDDSTREELLSRIPSGRFGQLSEIAAIVDFLLSRDAAYMTGSIVSVDGGSSI